MDENYCDYCEREGHRFRYCPRRDDEQEPDTSGPPRASNDEQLLAYLAVNRDTDPGADWL